MYWIGASHKGTSGKKPLGQGNELGSTAELESYYLYHAARADILRRMNRQDEALQEYRRAIALTTNTVEQQYLRRRIDELVPLTTSRNPDG